MVDLTDMFAKLDAYEEWAQQRAARGASGAAAEAQADMQATQAHGDITGATRAGYRAYVVTPQDDGTAVVDAAVAAVEALNPNQSATARGALHGQVGVVLTCPTTYQRKLETEHAGAKAVLAPTLQAYYYEFTARAAEGR